MRKSLSRSCRYTQAIIGLLLMGAASAARADEWEGTWSENCREPNGAVILSKSRFDLGTIELDCRPVGVRKLGSRYIADLSCDGEGGAQRMRAQLEVRNDVLRLSGVPARFGAMHRCSKAR